MTNFGIVLAVIALPIWVSSEHGPEVTLAAARCSKLAQVPDSATVTNSQKRPIAPGIVQYVIPDSPIYARGDIIKIKISAASRHVKAHAIFPFSRPEQARVDASYNTAEGGIFIGYKIPNSAPPGSYEITVYVQEIQSKAEEKHTVEIEIKP